jgi:hypothetical protein
MLILQFGQVAATSLQHSFIGFTESKDIHQLDPLQLVCAFCRQVKYSMNSFHVEQGIVNSIRSRCSQGRLRPIYTTVNGYDGQRDGQINNRRAFHVTFADKSTNYQHVSNRSFYGFELPKALIIACYSDKIFDLFPATH